MGALLFAAILHFPGNASHSSWRICIDDHKELWVYWTHHLWYMKWCRSVDRRSRVQTGVTIQGIWNVLCTASNSNFWTQRAFCSSANKSLWAAFSDTAENRSPLVREVRMKVFLKAASVRSGRLKLICKISIYLRFGHVFLALLVVIVNKWISTSLIIASRSSQSST